MRPLAVLRFGVLAVLFLYLGGAVLSAILSGEEELLREAGIPTDGPSLLRELERRSAGETDQKRVDRLIHQLGSDAFHDREAATHSLVGIGLNCLPRLREALNKTEDYEVAGRLKSIMEKIDRSWNPAILRALVRNLVRSQPQGAMEALLRFLPAVAGLELEEEVWFGLDDLACRDNKLPTAILDGLRDSSPTRRAACAYLVARRGQPDQRRAVYPLLADADPSVCLRAAQGLLAAGDWTAVPALVNLLRECSIEISWQAEELLRWAAGKTSPKALVGTGAAEPRKQSHQAWSEWWKKHEASLSLTAAYQNPTRPRLLLVRTPIPRTPTPPAHLKGQLDGKEEQRVWLCGSDGRQRWETITPFGSVELLSGPRLVVIEPAARRIAERDLDGALIRQWKANWAEPWLAAQRLPNGNYFVPGNSRAAEYTPDGKEVYNREFRGGDYSCSHLRKLENGNVLGIIDRGRLEAFAEFDPQTGRLLKQFPFQGPQGVRSYKVKTRTLGRSFIIEGLKSRILEVNERGNVVRECRIDQPLDVIGLRNGNLLVLHGEGIAELNQQGRTLWQAVAPVSADFHVCFGLLALGFDRPLRSDLDLATSVPYWVERLCDEDVAVRRHAASRLQVLGSKAKTAIPALLGSLDDPDSQVRSSAAWAIAEVGSEALPHLLKAAKDPRPRVRAIAINALGRFYSEMSVTLPVLLASIKDEHPLVRDSALVTLQSSLFSQRNNPEKGAITDVELDLVVKSLVMALKSKDTTTGPHGTPVPQMAAIILASIGPKAKAAIPALLDALTAEDVQLRMSAATALGFIGSEAKGAIPALLRLLNSDLACGPDDIFFLRHAVLMSLQRLGHQHETMEAVLISAMLDKRLGTSARMIAAEALGRIIPLTERAVVAFAQAAKDENEQVRGLAVQVLENKGR